MQWAIILTAIAGAVFIFLCGWELSKTKERLTFPEIKNYQIVVSLAVIIAIGLFIRTYYSIPNVFQGGTILYLESDAYYHMGAVDNIFRDLGSVPLHTIIFEQLQGYRLMALIIAGLSWIVGLGNPSPYLIDSVGALLPPVVSVAVIIVAYLLASRLFNQYVALTACLFIAIIPSEFLHRSLVGFTDQHVFEVLYSLGVALFMVMASKAVGKRQLVYYALAGVALFFYMVNWEGGLFMVFVVLVYWLAQCAIMFFRKENYMGFTTRITLVLLVANVLSFSFQPRMLLRIYMAVATFLPLVVTSIYWLYHHKRPIPASIMLACIILPLFVVMSSAIYLFVAAKLSFISEEVYSYYNPSLVLWAFLMVANFFTPDMVISEAQPLLFPNGVFSMQFAWSNFQWLFFLQFASLGFIIGKYRRHLDHRLLVFIVWASLMFIATMCLRRYAYYLTISIAILGSVFIYQLFTNLNLKKATTYATYGFVVLFMAYMMVIPALKVSELHRGQISVDWQESLAWLKNQPESQVTAWGDYGHWIRRIADKEVRYTAGTTGSDVARLFVYDGIDSSYGGADYVIIDRETVSGKFHAAISGAGLDRGDFYEPYYYWREVANGKPKLTQLVLFYPRYYESLSVRLFYFNQGDYTPPDVPVYYYQSKVVNEREIKIIADVKRYGTVGEARLAIARNDTKGVIASEYPSFSPVPLSFPDELKVVYSTESVKIARAFLTK